MTDSPSKISHQNDTMTHGSQERIRALLYKEPKGAGTNNHSNDNSIDDSDKVSIKSKTSSHKINPKLGKTQSLNLSRQTTIV